MRSLILVPLLCPLLFAQLPTVEEKTKGMDIRTGFFPLFWEEKTGKLWMEVGRFNEPFLYVHGLASGLGSNPVGLDRKQLGGTSLVHFVRIGPKILLVRRNMRFRALSEDVAEREAVRESFAESVVFGFEVAAETDGRALVDATDFVVRDAHGVVGKLERTKQGAYQLDSERSAIWMERTNAFPRNTEMEAVLTFAGKKPGAHVRETTPNPSSITLRQHHAFIVLPAAGYKPRVADPRTSSFAVTFSDYAAALDQPLEQRWIARHRLEKQDPHAELSRPKEPIVYYVDRGIPEPVRSAVLEGASWWKTAFEKAGFKDAFKVELLPEGADPLDVRYNVINWVHRSTRGWSYGSSVMDPRTGEIIKGHVLLGSLRVRQDRMIFEGLSSPFDGGAFGCPCSASPPGGDALAYMDPKTDAVALALARIRQLAAHEVGHTLGFAHNFAASVNDRASVMDYPAPKVGVRSDGTLDLSDAYAVGIGGWDIQAVRYAYTQFPADVDEAEGLGKIVAEGIAAGLHFASDRDARSLGTSHALAHLWDNGADPVKALVHALEVRRVALEGMSEKAIPAGAPLASLEETMVPVYLHHRFQLEAATKLIGGYHYTYALRGDGQVPLRPVTAARQRMALQQVMKALEPETLALPAQILQTLPPSAFGGRSIRAEPFPRRTGAVFDPLSAAETAADLALAALLHPERASRLATPGGAVPRALDLSEVVSTLLERTWFTRPSTDPYAAAIERTVERRLLDRLFSLATDVRASSDVHAIVTGNLRLLATSLRKPSQGASPHEAEHRALAADDVDRFLSRPWKDRTRSAPLDVPPGSPIGR